MTTHDWDSLFAHAERKFDAGDPLTPAEVATLINGYRGEISLLHERLALESRIRLDFESECG